MHTQHVYTMRILLSCIYCNPDDSALIVPSRSGTGFSYNYASHTVWAVGVLPLILLLYIFIAMLRS